eukprot:TRINITY_DN3461_c0_g1_i14.p1 TRINITY_DN3461_c0_g1~~TRINITY_DN3461_c0_g1_i14.p1  ORF type:complete len:246 (-),score=51.42 TRINITY_DN3461_c0_g1_i14:170-907(-)
MMEGLRFLHAIQADTSSVFTSVSLYTSHEGLLLNYEEANTKFVPGLGFYNLGAHFLWVGDRTRDPKGAHIEYFRGICNPIGIKCGPTLTPEELGELLEILNPIKEEGRITLITRYGASKVRDILPKHIKVVKQMGHPVVWCCDPCHGNTVSTPTGLKTRRLEAILEEIVQTFDTHKEEGTFLGGLHVEMTGENVTECIGGSDGLTVGHLSERYETLCDPRLNYTQSLDVAFLVAKKLKQCRKSHS